MFEDTGTATGFFNNAHKLIEAYHTVLLPLCRDTGLPPLALDILLYLANHPQQNMARDICRCRGLKPGIVSVHVDRLVREGLLRRSEVPGDRRKTQLLCTDQAQPIIEQGRTLQKHLAETLLTGLTASEIEVFRHCLNRLSQNIDYIRQNGIQYSSAN